MQLPPDESVVMVAGHPPIKARKLRYYQDRNFTRRVMPPPVLSGGHYADRPAARTDDWSDTPPLVAPAPSVASNADELADEGGYQLKPELDVVGITPPLPVDGDLLVLDDEDDTPLRPRDVMRQFSRNARFAALDPNDGIAL